MRISCTESNPRAQQLSLQNIDRLVRREPHVMACDDCFWIIGVILLSSINLMWLLGKTNPQPTPQPSASLPSERDAILTFRAGP